MKRIEIDQEALGGIANKLDNISHRVNYIFVTIWILALTQICLLLEVIK